MRCSPSLQPGGAPCTRRRSLIDCPFCEHPLPLRTRGADRVRGLGPARSAVQALVGGAEALGDAMDEPDLSGTELTPSAATVAVVPASPCSRGPSSPTRGFPARIEAFGPAGGPPCGPAMDGGARRRDVRCDDVRGGSGGVTGSEKTAAALRGMAQGMLGHAPVSSRILSHLVEDITLRSFIPHERDIDQMELVDGRARCNSPFIPRSRASSPASGRKSGVSTYDDRRTATRASAAQRFPAGAPSVRPAHRAAGNQGDPAQWRHGVAGHQLRHPPRSPRRPRTLRQRRPSRMGPQPRCPDPRHRAPDSAARRHHPVQPARARPAPPDGRRQIHRQAHPAPAAAGDGDRVRHPGEHGPVGVFRRSGLGLRTAHPVPGDLRTPQCPLRGPGGFPGTEPGQVRLQTPSRPAKGGARRVPALHVGNRRRAAGLTRRRPDRRARPRARSGTRRSGDHRHLRPAAPRGLRDDRPYARSEQSPAAAEPRVRSAAQRRRAASRPHRGTAPLPVRRPDRSPADRAPGHHPRGAAHPTWRAAAVLAAFRQSGQPGLPGTPRTSSTRPAEPAATSPSATASTTVWAHRWPVWSCAPPSPHCSTAFPA